MNETIIVDEILIYPNKDNVVNAIDRKFCYFKLVSKDKTIDCYDFICIGSNVRLDALMQNNEVVTRLFPGYTLDYDNPINSFHANKLEYNIIEHTVKGIYYEEK